MASAIGTAELDGAAPPLDLARIRRMKSVDAYRRAVQLKQNDRAISTQCVD
jgi:hypothetical protein